MLCICINVDAFRTMQRKDTVYYKLNVAFLYWAYDMFIHGANFLVARYIHQVTCVACHSIDASCRISDIGLRRTPLRFLWSRSYCHPFALMASSSSNSWLSISKFTIAHWTKKLIDPQTNKQSSNTRWLRRGWRSSYTKTFSAANTHSLLNLEFSF